MSNLTIDPKVLKSMGINTAQIDTTKVTTSKKVTEPNTKTEHLKFEAKTSIKTLNSKHGKESRFVCLQRDGKTSDGKPKYKPVKMEGDWVIEKNKDGTFTASRVHYYTESYIIADFTLVGNKSDIETLDEELGSREEVKPKTK